MNKFFKRIAAAVSALFIGAALTGCSEYVMTEEDLAIQKKIEGYWVADYDTGYNYFDDDGKLFSMIVMEFTDDFHYLMHQCMVQQGYALTYPPVAYSFEELKFKAVSNGVTSYAAVEFSDDGQKMYWITDEKTDTYLRIDKEEAEELGIPEYDPKSWEESETVSGSDGSDSSESQLGSEGSESVSETSESGSETDKNGASAEVAAMALIPAEPDPFDNLAHTVTFTAGEKTLTAENTDEYYPDGIEDIGWGNIIEYVFNDGEITLNAAPSANGWFYGCMPEITAQVVYTGDSSHCNAELKITDMSLSEE